MVIKQNLLWRTRTYLVGNMENVTSVEGTGWRDWISVPLEKMGVVVYNPFKKPFLQDVKEGPQEVRDNLYSRNSGDYDILATKMKEIRSYDLNLVDRSDFLIAHINPTVASWGSAEELVTGVREKKPIFLSIEGGKKNCPLWIFGMFPHKYIYDSPSDVLETLIRIDNGELPIDSNRWKLLRKEWR